MAYLWHLVEFVELAPLSLRANNDETEQRRDCLSQAFAGTRTAINNQLLQ